MANCISFIVFLHTEAVTGCPAHAGCMCDSRSVRLAIQERLEHFFVLTVWWFVFECQIVRQHSVISCTLLHTCEFLQQTWIFLKIKYIGHLVVLYKLPNSPILPSEQQTLLLHCVDVRLQVSTITCSSSGCKNIIIIIIFLHGLGRLTCSGFDALPSFLGASTISSSSRFAVEGVFRQSGVVHSFEVDDPVLFVFESNVLYPRDL